MRVTPPRMRPVTSEAHHSRQLERDLRQFGDRHQHADAKDEHGEETDRYSIGHYRHGDVRARPGPEQVPATRQ